MKERRKGEARTTRCRLVLAQQLDVFAGRDVRGTAPQLDLFGVEENEPRDTEEEGAS